LRSSSTTLALGPCWPGGTIAAPGQTALLGALLDALLWCRLPALRPALLDAPLRRFRTSSVLRGLRLCYLSFYTLGSHVRGRPAPSTTVATST
jgi:hypothetical protein